jgi:Domain of Unknown Function (DUF1543)
MKQKLFVIYIGGSTEQSLIELHDIRFVVASQIEETYEELKKSWWGTPKSLHLDCWGALEYADGYKIELVSGDGQPPVADTKKLYFVNLGGYSSEEFTEIHRNVFLVATSEAEAKKRAVASMRDTQQGHKDYMYEVESAFCLNQIVDEKSLHLRLSPVENSPKFQFEFGYVPIGKKT